MSLFLPRFRPLKPATSNTSLERRNDLLLKHSKCGSINSEKLEDLYAEKPVFQDNVYPDSYWKFKKSMEYLSYKRPLLTTLSLIAAYDCDFQDPVMIKALKDFRLLEILLNFLEYHDKRLRIVSMRFLKKLGRIRLLRHEIVFLDGIPSIVELLKHPDIDIRKPAADLIGFIADFHKAQEAVRFAGGISSLAQMLFVSRKILFNHSQLTSRQSISSVIDAAEAAAMALLQICDCSENQIEFLLSGALKECESILQSNHTHLCVLALRIISKCAVQESVRTAVKNLGMLEHFRLHFFAEDQDLIQAAALATYKCADDDESKKIVFAKFVDKLYEMIQTSSLHSDYDFMVTVSVALWKSAENKANLERFQALNAVPLLIQLLTYQPKKVQEFLVACLSCCMTNPQLLAIVRKNNGIEIFIELLNTTYPPLIIHLNNALAVSSSDNECLAIIKENGALSLMWSHLKNKDASVISNTAWQLATILANMPYSTADFIRSFAGGMQIVIECLQSEDPVVLTSTCALTVVLCKDLENVRTLSDYQVVAHLAKLTKTENVSLQYHLCLAIKACCSYSKNRDEFANRQVVYPLIRVLKSGSDVVQGAATQALEELSRIPYWCAIMYNISGVYETFMMQIKRKDEKVQEYAAAIIQKMRLFALNRDGYIPPWLIKKHATYFRDD